MPRQRTLQAGMCHGLLCTITLAAVYISCGPRDSIAQESDRKTGRTERITGDDLEREQAENGTASTKRTTGTRTLIRFLPIYDHRPGQDDVVAYTKFYSNGTTERVDASSWDPSVASKTVREASATYVELAKINASIRSKEAEIGKEQRLRETLSDSITEARRKISTLDQKIRYWNNEVTRLRPRPFRCPNGASYSRCTHYDRKQRYLESQDTYRRFTIAVIKSNAKYESEKSQLRNAINKADSSIATSRSKESTLEEQIMALARQKRDLTAVAQSTNRRHGNPFPAYDIHDE